LDFTRLVEIREDKDLSQRKLAKVLRVSKSTYARWETQEQIIPLSRLNDFCNYFKVSMDYVMGITKINNSTNSLEELDKKVIGAKLKKIRKNNNLTQAELALLLNTSHSTISAYESGKTLILTIFAREICKKFDYSLDWLCNRKK
jgi:transcriptional regulator with XRE-family HTH domain